MAGFLAVAKADMAILSKIPFRWTVLFRILSISATHPMASSYSFELTCLIVSGHPDSHVAADHFGDCVDLLLSFSGVLGPLPNLMPSSPTRKEAKNGISLALDRALKAIEKLYNLHLIIPKLIDASGPQSKRSWFEFWLPVLCGLQQQCSHPSADIRHLAMSYLQRLLLSDELGHAVDQNKELQNRIDCFDIVIFPIFDELKTLDTVGDSAGGSETLVRGCVLVTKAFLHFTPSIAASKEFKRVWSKILDLFASVVQTAVAKDNLYAVS
jgi:brefeldin A-resistance guanine nucleotide exchange factor 1